MNQVASPPTSSTAPKEAILGLYAGDAFRTLAEQYATLPEVIREIVQNAVDDDVAATKIEILLNYQSRRLIIRDNGRGITTEKFNTILGTVAKRQRKGLGTIGEFGIGLISPLGKCEQFIFTSCPEPEIDKFHRWEFVCSDILNQAEKVKIPNFRQYKFTLGDPTASSQTQVWWRSEMKLFGLTTDTIISRVDLGNLINEIQSTCGGKMRKYETKISVEIIRADGTPEKEENLMAPRFDGQPLPVKTIKHPGPGLTVFQLYVAAKTSKGRRGKVLVGSRGNDFRLPFNRIAHQFPPEYLDPKIVQDLCSGILEGEITCDGIEADARRDRFKASEPLIIGLSIVISEWYKKHGQQHIENTKQDRQEERWQEICTRAVKAVEDVLRDSKYNHLRELVNNFKFGSIGRGHAEPPTDAILGESPHTSISTNGGPYKPRDKGSTAPQMRDHQPSQERLSHTPIAISGTRGTKRRIVAESSFGLHFMTGECPGSSNLWEADMEAGVITFNIRHPNWNACDTKDSHLSELVENITFQVLTVLTSPAAQQPSLRRGFDEFNDLKVDRLVSGSKKKGH